MAVLLHMGSAKMIRECVMFLGQFSDGSVAVAESKMLIRQVDGWDLSAAQRTVIHPARIYSMAQLRSQETSQLADFKGVVKPCGWFKGPKTGRIVAYVAKGTR